MRSATTEDDTEAEAHCGYPGFPLRRTAVQGVREAGATRRRSALEALEVDLARREPDEEHLGLREHDEPAVARERHVRARRPEEDLAQQRARLAEHLIPRIS